jgi:hypothetical protein
VPSRRARGWRRGGRGRSPFSAHPSRSNQLVKAQTLSAIVDGEFTRLVLSHHHPSLSGPPSADFAIPVAAADFCNGPPDPRLPLVPPLSRRLRPVAAPSDAADDSRLLRPPFARVTPVVLANVVFLQKAVGFRLVGDPAQPQLLGQSILMGAVIAHYVASASTTWSEGRVGHGHLHCSVSARVCSKRRPARHGLESCVWQVLHRCAGVGQLPGLGRHSRAGNCGGNHGLKKRKTIPPGRKDRHFPSAAECCRHKPHRKQTHR